MLEKKTLLAALSNLPHELDFVKSRPNTAQIPYRVEYMQIVLCISKQGNVVVIVATFLFCLIWGSLRTKWMLAQKFSKLALKIQQTILQKTNKQWYICKVRITGQLYIVTISLTLSWMHMPYCRVQKRPTVCGRSLGAGWHRWYTCTHAGQAQK